MVVPTGRLGGDLDKVGVRRREKLQARRGDKEQPDHADERPQRRRQQARAVVGEQDVRRAEAGLLAVAVSEHEPQRPGPGDERRQQEHPDGDLDALDGRESRSARPAPAARSAPPPRRRTTGRPSRSSVRPGTPSPSCAPRSRARRRRAPARRAPSAGSRRGGGGGVEGRAGDEQHGAGREGDQRERVAEQPAPDRVVALHTSSAGSRGTPRSCAAPSCPRSAGGPAPARSGRAR